MRDELVYCEYSTDREYRFEIYKRRNLYKIWLQRKITDGYMGNDWFDYNDIADAAHFADSTEKATELGREYLRCLI